MPKDIMYVVKLHSKTTGACLRIEYLPILVKQISVVGDDSKVFVRDVYWWVEVLQV